MWLSYVLILALEFENNLKSAIKFYGNYNIWLLLILSLKMTWAITLAIYYLIDFCEWSSKNKWPYQFENLSYRTNDRSPYTATVERDFLYSTGIVIPDPRPASPTIVNNLILIFCFQYYQHIVQILVKLTKISLSISLHGLKSCIKHFRSFHPNSFWSLFKQKKIKKSLRTR